MMYARSLFAAVAGLLLASATPASAAAIIESGGDVAVHDADWMAPPPQNAKPARIVSEFQSFVDRVLGENMLSLDSAFRLPEPGTWAMIIIGFGVIGMSVRRRARRTSRSSVI